MKKYQDITQHEIEALKQKYNLADAHTHQSQSSTQRNIISNLDQLWFDSENSKQASLEKIFINKFFQMKGIDNIDYKDVMLHYSASVSTIHIANYLLQKKLSVSLLEPCFDNIHDILNGFEINTSPIDESIFTGSDIYNNLCDKIKTDCLFLIDPNNPTGFTFLDRKYKNDFEEVVRYCQDKNKILIIDYCFSNFILFREEVEFYNPYLLFEKYDLTYIAIEDTGKTWPTQDAKISLLTSSKNIYKDLYSIYTSYVLNISPFILNLLIKYIDDSVNNNFSSIHKLLDRNRNYAREKLKNTSISIIKPRVFTSVLWCESKKHSAEHLHKILVEKDIYIIQGSFFYWKNKKEGKSYFRIALARDSELFFSAIDSLVDALS